MVKNLSCNAGDTGSIPGQGIKIPHVAGQLSPHTTTTEPMSSGASMPQLERSPCAKTGEKPAHCNKRSCVLELRPREGRERGEGREEGRKGEREEGRKEINK